MENIKEVIEICLEETNLEDVSEFVELREIKVKVAQDA